MVPSAKRWASRSKPYASKHRSPAKDHCPAAYSETVPVLSSPKDSATCHTRAYCRRPAAPAESSDPPSSGTQLNRALGHAALLHRQWNGSSCTAYPAEQSLPASPEACVHADIPQELHRLSKRPLLGSKAYMCPAA